MTVLWIFLILIIVIGIIIVLSYLVPIYGQNATPTPVVAPTPVPTPTPTTPNPNWQFLPQKAYVIPFAPEQGVPQSTIPLQSVPTVIPQQQQGQGQLDTTTSIMGIIGIVGAAGAYLKGHFADKKAEKAEVITKDSMGSILDNKENLKELARILYQMNPEKANNITDAPSIKLETLEKDAAEFRDKAAKA